ncbi:MAG: type II toxin-antitoxin system RelE/ParE family toxin [Geminicoccaceae bacterium]
MRIIWSPRALQHMDEIRRFVARDQPAAAIAIAARIRRSVDSLSNLPGRGRPGRVPETRELVVPRTPYIVPYAVRDDTIEILAVLHSARRWPRSFD